MSNAKARPPFIISTADVPEKTFSYPNSQELMGPSRAIGRVAGLLKIGLHVTRLHSGQRSSWPHAESQEEEFVYVLEGAVEAWIDGVLHPMKAGDLAAFPSGTGICHTFLNNGTEPATLLVGGEADRANNQIYYPLHPARQADLPWSRWWSDRPQRQQGPHDGQPDALRASPPDADPARRR